MTGDAVIAAIVGTVILASCALVWGALLNIRSIRAGRGPSNLGIALQAATLGIVQIIVAVVGLVITAQVGAWPALILLLPFIIGAVVLLAGAAQRLRRQRL